MKEFFLQLKSILQGTWTGEGFAKFPTITDTAYTEVLELKPDRDKDCIHFNQITKYKNETDNNGKTVFWDTGFFVLKEKEILLVSAQSGGRLETYKLTNYTNNNMHFDSVRIDNDPKTTRSQRIFYFNENTLRYELNMSTKQAAEFQNHLSASLVKISC